MKTVKVNISSGLSDIHKLIIDDNITILFTEISHEEKLNSIDLFFNEELIASFKNEDYQKLLEVLDF